MRNLKQYEALATYTDNDMGNNVFAVKYMGLDDLSKKSQNSKINARPENDLLDPFQEGDIVTGEGIHDEDIHTGPVVSIKKDEDGENIEITIEENGEIVELKATTVSMEQERGNNGDQGIAASDFNPDDNPDEIYPPKMMEDKTTFKNLKSFSDFTNEK
jgi:hypothetical protein